MELLRPREHPLCALGRLSGDERETLALAIRECPDDFFRPADPLYEDATLRGFIAQYQWEWHMQQARDAALMDGKGGFTFALVVLAKSDKDPSGEFELFRFCCLNTAGDALRFLLRFMRMQRCEGHPACLMECGPALPHLSARKWILDIDGKCSDLLQAGILPPETTCIDRVQAAQIHSKVVRLGCAIAKGLCDLGYTVRTCHIAVKTRHAPLGDGYSKLSWHLTLCVMGMYAQLRAAVTAVSAAFCPPEIASAKQNHTPIPPDYLSHVWAMFYCLDDHILDNTQGQNIQVAESRKVLRGDHRPAPTFAVDTLYLDCMRQKWPKDNSSLAYAVTSMSLPDPWSIPLVEKELPDVAVAAPRPPRPLVQRSAVAAEWGLLPCPWMVDFLRASDGTSRLTPVSSSWRLPQPVEVEVARGGADILFLSNVLHPARCPRHAVHQDVLHRHGGNGVAAVCARLRNPAEGQPAEHLFVFCYSRKCRALGPGWTYVPQPI